jgi:Fe-S cluster assembly iron-binding protein IscA
MTATEQKIEALKKTLNLMARIAGDIQSDDYEALDALRRALRDAGCELFELELSLQPNLEGDFIERSQIEARGVRVLTDAHAAQVINHLANERIDEMKNTTNKRAGKAASKRSATLKQRAQAIINNTTDYDIDTRLAVSLALSSLTFYESGGRSAFSPEELPAHIAEGEKELLEAVARAEAGEPVRDDGIEEGYGAAARTMIGLLDNEAVPDFFKGAITRILNLIQAEIGIKLWSETAEGDAETGGYSTLRLARFFKFHQFYDLEIERKKDLAELIAAVLNHRDVPWEIKKYLDEGVSETFNSLDDADSVTRSPEYIRRVLAVRRKENEQKKAKDGALK